MTHDYYSWNGRPVTASEFGTLVAGKLRQGWQLTPPCPTCSPPSRETVNMVCQTCGWDYAKGEKGQPQARTGD